MLCSERDGGSAAHVGRAEEGSTAPAIGISKSHLFAVCSVGSQRTGLGAVGKSDSPTFYVITPAEVGEEAPANQSFSISLH